MRCCSASSTLEPAIQPTSTPGPEDFFILTGDLVIGERRLVAGIDHTLAAHRRIFRRRLHVASRADHGRPTGGVRNGVSFEAPVPDPAC